MKKISIANDFSRVTGLRHCDKSEKSGEEFYHTILNSAFYEAYQSNDFVELDLDGTLDAYAPSFLDEAIGNLVYDFSLSEVKKRLKITSRRNISWITMIENETYSEWEKRRKQGNPRKITEPHNDWYRLNDKGEIEQGQWC